MTFLLRILFLACVALPLLPLSFILPQGWTHRTESFQVWAPLWIERDPVQSKNLRHNLEQILKHQKYEINVYGSLEESREFSLKTGLEELIRKDKGSPTVFVTDGVAYGQSIQEFQLTLQKSLPFAQKRIWISPFELNPPSEYVVISSLRVPSLVFLGTDNQVQVELVGKGPAYKQIKGQLLFYNKTDFLTDYPLSLSYDAHGILKQNISVPLRFLQAGTQSVTVQLQSNKSREPLNIASAVLQVNYPKATILHLGYGPDWMLRMVRQKLKVHDNLDLLSYYILRTPFSVLPESSDQLSLIEFPAEKLFGEKLSTFHGVLIQNFPLNTYLSPTDREHLLRYVFQDGGRLVIQAGPSSVGDEFFPCKADTYRWDATPTTFTAAQGIFSSRMHVSGCQLKPNAMMLGEFLPSHDPALVAMPLGRGLIVTVLASDWLMPSTKPRDISLQGQFLLQQTYAQQNELWQWIVEFLQRRRDVFLRPPDPLGPRWYEKQKHIHVWPRGSSTQSPWVPLNGKELHYEVQAPETNSPLPFAQIQAWLGAPDPLRTYVMPVFPHSAVKQEAWPHPLFFEDLPLLEAEENNLNWWLAASRQQTQLASVSLSQAYPFLLSIALLLLGCEQAWTRIRRKSPK